MSSTTKTTIFTIWFVIPLLMAIFPPFYLWSSGQTGLILGMPFAIAYWIIDVLILLAGLFALFHVEVVRGEVGAEEDNI